MFACVRRWVPKAPLIGHEHKVFLLDFFGAKGPTRGGIKVPPSRILTAFPTFPGNTFLGFAVPRARLPSSEPGGRGAVAAKRAQGVIWGKDPKHYAGRDALLKVRRAGRQRTGTLGHCLRTRGPLSLSRARARTGIVQGRDSWSLDGS